MKVSAKLGSPATDKDGKPIANSDRTVEVDYDFGENIEQMTSKFNPEVVFNNALSAMVINLQALIRRGIKAGKTDAQIAEAASAWKPDVRQISGKSTMEKTVDLFSKLSADEKKAAVAQLKELLKQAA